MPSLILLVDLCLYGKNGRRIRLWESKNLNTWPTIVELHLEIMNKTPPISIFFHISFDKYLMWLRKIFLLSLAHHHVNETEKVTQHWENRLGYFLFSPLCDLLAFCLPLISPQSLQACSCPIQTITLVLLLLYIQL